MTLAEVTGRVEVARRYASAHGLTYVPCFAKGDGGFVPVPLDAPDALKLLIRVRHVPADTIARWWTGAGLAELRLSLCTMCQCNPIANELGTCWWCERHPYACGTRAPRAPAPINVPQVAPATIPVAVICAPDAPVVEQSPDLFDSSVDLVVVP